MDRQIDAAADFAAQFDLGRIDRSETALRFFPASAANVVEAVRAAEDSKRKRRTWVLRLRGDQRTHWPFPA